LKKTVRDIAVKGKRVLIRVDFNVPLDPQTRTIRDDARIRASLPTINYLVERKAKVILCSHLGRPRGRAVKELSLSPIANKLSQLLGKKVKVAPDCIGKEVEAEVAGLNEGDILLLENLRFHPQEEENEPTFSQALASLADVFVNDAFSVSHRAHASVVGITHYLPAVAGFLLEKELQVLEKILTQPSSPFAGVLGGAKVRDKIGVLSHILERVDGVFIGGGMAATFLKAQGYPVGLSPIEEDMLGFCCQIMDRAKAKGIPLILPIDVMVANKLESGASVEIAKVKEIPANKIIGDIGPETVKLFCSQLQDYKTIFWNGPLGVFEIPEFAQGTQALAQFLSQLSATTVVGGGSTAEAVQGMGLGDKMTYLSLGGGAFLEFLEGKSLPGIAVLPQKKG